MKCIKISLDQLKQMITEVKTGPLLCRCKAVILEIKDFHGNMSE